MSSETISIAVDALGADNAPSVVLEGVSQALEKDKKINIYLCGPREAIESFCDQNERCTPIFATEEIKMGEHPAMAVRKKKDSSIVVGCKLVKEGKADGFFSAGNTGACLAAATLIIGRIKGILRPMLATTLPTVKDNKNVLFCDLGANADCKSSYIVQFGIMASCYKKAVEKIKNPKIGLLNIGEEESKGSSFAQECYEALNKKLSNFTGNAEGRDLLSGNFDAVITDGFTGNIVLKSMEGTFKMVFKLLKKSFLSNLKSKLGALLLKRNLKSMVEDLDPESIGAALLFGINGSCCIGHGNSSSKAICNGILNTANFVKCDVVGAIKEEIDTYNE